jgi:hypothetical protein
MSVDIERVSVSLGAKRSLPGRPYENYDAHIMIEARMMPGKSLKERNQDWAKLRKKAQAQLREALADAKHVAETAHGTQNQENLKTYSKPKEKSIGESMADSVDEQALLGTYAKSVKNSDDLPAITPGVIGFSFGDESPDYEVDEEAEKENLRLGKILRERGLKKWEEIEKRKADKKKKDKKGKGKKK